MKAAKGLKPIELCPTNLTRAVLWGRQPFPSVQQLYKSQHCHLTVNCSNHLYKFLRQDGDILSGLVRKQERYHVLFKIYTKSVFLFICSNGPKEDLYMHHYQYLFIIVPQHWSIPDRSGDTI